VSKSIRSYTLCTVKTDRGRLVCINCLQIRLLIIILKIYSSRQLCIIQKRNSLVIIKIKLVIRFGLIIVSPKNY